MARRTSATCASLGRLRDCPGWMRWGLRICGLAVHRAGHSRPSPRSLRESFHSESPFCTTRACAGGAAGNAAGRAGEIGRCLFAVKEGGLGEGTIGAGFALASRVSTGTSLCRKARCARAYSPREKPGCSAAVQVGMPESSFTQGRSSAAAATGGALEVTLALGSLCARASRLARSARIARAYSPREIS